MKKLTAEDLVKNTIPYEPIDPTKEVAFPEREVNSALDFISEGASQAKSLLESNDFEGAEKTLTIVTLALTAAVTALHEKKHIEHAASSFNSQAMN